MSTNINKKPYRSKYTYSYYKKSYRANERYRIQKGIADYYSPMLHKSEWQDKIDAGYTNKDIVYSQFHTYDRQAASEIYDQLTEALTKHNSLVDQGVLPESDRINAKFSRSQIAKGPSAFTPEMWDLLDSEYHALVAGGMSGSEAKAIISHRFFGSK